MLKAHVGRWSEDCPEHQGVVVYSMNDTPLVSFFKFFKFFFFKKKNPPIGGFAVDVFFLRGSGEGGHG